MKITVLVDNNTYIDRYFYGEPAVSYYIEDGNNKLLFDVGYSDLFIRNAEAMKIDLHRISSIVISHGHNDHTGGLAYLSRYMDISDKTVIAHPLAFKKTVWEEEDIGSPLAKEELAEYCKLRLSKEPIKISKKLTFLGEIPSYNDFEIRDPIGKAQIEGAWKDDLIMDDTALAYEGEKGLFIITGCSHSGICNIVEHAKKICKTARVLGVIGGFHLFNISPKLKGTIDYFLKNEMKEIYPCHCVSFEAKAEIHKRIPIKEVAVGMELEVL